MIIICLFVKNLVRRTEGQVMLEDNFKKVKINDLTVPNKNGVFKCMHNFYWAVTDDDCVLFYRNVTPQANTNISIMESFQNKEKGMYPFNTRIQLIENIFIPIHANGWEIII